MASNRVPPLGSTSASTSAAGVVQLTDSTSSTSTTTAATPNSVKSAYDLANAAIPKSLTTTTGDIIYASSANTPARLGIGSSGQVLSVSGGIPVWTAPAGGGKVLQVVTTAFTATTNTTSTSYVDINGASLSITPSSASSRILILGYFNTATGGQADRAGTDINIVRNSTQIFETVQANDYGGGMTGGYSWQRVGWSPVFVDSPATTSLITYKFQFKVESSNYPNTSINESGNPSTITLLEIGA